MKRTTPKLLWTVIVLAACYSVRSEDLAKYVFRLPVFEGMAEYGSTAFNKFPTGRNVEYVVITRCFQAQPGIHIPAKMISNYYYNHFVSLGLIPWQKGDSLTGRFVLSNIVIKGEAHVFTQGTIMYWIPSDGNFIGFHIEQKRNYTIGETDKILASIICVFEEAASEYGFTVFQPENITVSDWQTYYENESFVDQRVCFVKYKDVDGWLCMRDDGNYMFRFSVYANAQCAAQRFQDMQDSRENTATSQTGLCFPPVVLNNVVIEYLGDVFDEPNSEFTHCVRRKLKDMVVNNRLEAIGLP